MPRGCFDDTKVMLGTSFYINLLSTSFMLTCSLCFTYQGAVLIKNLAAKEPSALGLDTYYKQYYLCLAAAAASIKWYF